jgi:hypothetical protein
MPHTALFLIALACTFTVTDQPITNSNHGDNWGLDRIDQATGTDGTYHYFATGAGVNIYIVGMGVRTDHVDFGGRAAHVGDFCTGTRRTGSQPFDPRSSPLGDGFDGHETHVASYAAGTKSGVAKGARIYSLRTGWNDDTNRADGGTYCLSTGDNNVAVAAAFDWVAANGHTYPDGIWRPAVVNFSGGFGNSTLRAAISNAMTAGFVVTLSGDTGGLVSQHWGTTVPKTALVVGGTSALGPPLHSFDTALAKDRPDGTSGRYDNTTPGLLALYAPADGLYGAGKASDNKYSIPELDGCATCHGGDSFAAPFVAGAAAQYLESHPAASPCEVRQAIIDSSTPNVVHFQASGEQSANRFLHLPVVLINTPNCT